MIDTQARIILDLAGKMKAAKLGWLEFQVLCYLYICHEPRTLEQIRNEVHVFPSVIAQSGERELLEGICAQHHRIAIKDTAGLRQYALTRPGRDLLETLISPLRSTQLPVTGETL